jgi:nitrite reductase (NO-forming)
VIATAAVPGGRALAGADGPARVFTLTVEDRTIDIGYGLKYSAWTYNGAVPGPLLRARQGELVEIRLANHTDMSHGIEIDSAQLAPNRHFSEPAGKKTMSYQFRAAVPGVFLYHCSAIPMLNHIANGMFGMMIVDPAAGWPPAHEVMIVQSEFYGSPNQSGLIAGDTRKMMAEQPDYIVFNGALERYVDHPIQIKVGELVRVFFVNAGPNLLSTFHVLGVIFSAVYQGGNPADALHGVAGFEVGPGNGAVFEFRVSEPGDYTFIDHAMARPYKGAIGIFRAVR